MEWLHLAVKIAHLKFAWRAFQTGEADMNQQLIVKEIYKYLQSKPMPKRVYPACVRSMRMDSMIVERGYSQHDAAVYIAEMDGANLATVKREYQKWKAEGETSNNLDADRFISLKLSFQQELAQEEEYLQREKK